MKNVPGQEGDCMFLAVALASLTSVGLGANDVLLTAISKETRNVVASVLEQDCGNLLIEGKRLVSTRSLLSSATRQEGLSSPSEYLNMLRNGTLQGGGPELTVLANVLRRPISIYEVVATDDDIENSESDLNVDTAHTTTTTGRKTSEDQSYVVQEIQCMGTFGKDAFQDPLTSIPNSAILLANNDDHTPGAYSWHLHILVVNAMTPLQSTRGGKKQQQQQPQMEKHACVLLPQPPRVL